MMELVAHEVYDLFIPKGILQLIEKKGRKCYKSEEKITPISAIPFIKDILKKGHYAVLDHSLMSVDFITDRGMTHELVRHRLAAYCQESTRYCNYAGARLGEHVKVIRPIGCDLPLGTYDFSNTEIDMYKDDDWYHWLFTCYVAEQSYLQSVKEGMKPQQARGMLPISLKTDIGITADFTEWRHIFKLRTSKAAHPMIRTCMLELWEQIKKDFQEYAFIFEDCIGLDGEEAIESAKEEAKLVAADREKIT